MTDTASIGDYSPDHWQACEIRAVAAMATDEARAQYLRGVARHRGEEAAQRLRREVWELMRKAA